MTISVNYQASIIVVSTDTGDFVLPGNNSASFGTPDTSTGVLTASSTIPATKFSADNIAMTAGAATINFAALTGRSSEEVIVGTGLKCQLAYFRNPPANANDITIVEGVANGLALMGAAFSITLKPGQWLLWGGNDAAPDIASGDRLLDVTGTLTQTLDTFFVLG